MARQRLVARPTRTRGRWLTRPDKAAPPVPDLVKRDFTAPAINDKWCGDLTEVPTDEGKLYLATVEDLASKRIVGFGLSEHHDAELATAALKMAVTVRGGDVAGTIFHSDRGSEGGIRQSSQQLDSEELRWVFGSVSRRSVRCVVQCGRLVGRRGGGVSTVSASGRRSLAVCRARRRQRWPGWHPRWAPGGSVKVVACRRSVRPRCRGATCPSSSETRSPSCTRSAAGCARSLAARRGRCVPGGECARSGRSP
jgi:Integrase core domain